MNPIFYRITMSSGEQFISEFRRVQSPGKYLHQLRYGKGASIYHYTSTLHETSNEPIRRRSRLVLAGPDVRSVERVVRRLAADESYGPANFAPYTSLMVDDGTEVWRCPSPPPSAGLVPGVEYPLHIDAESNRTFVVVRAPNPDAGITDAVLFYVDPTTAAVGVHSLGHAAITPASGSENRGSEHGELEYGDDDEED
jgi:hypothetical protein